MDLSDSSLKSDGIWETSTINNCSMPQPSSKAQTTDQHTLISSALTIIFMKAGTTTSGMSLLNQSIDSTDLLVLKLEDVRSMRSNLLVLRLKTHLLTLLLAQLSCSLPDLTMLDSPTMFSTMEVLLQRSLASAQDTDLLLEIPPLPSKDMVSAHPLPPFLSISMVLLVLSRLPLLLRLLAKLAQDQICHHHL
jgi:hypothetical protein